MREKWLEKVEFEASETRDIDLEPNKLIMWNARNGDLYISICPKSHRGGISMRFERSGGCSTKNPRLLNALTDAYDAIANNEDNTPTKKLQDCLSTMEELIKGKENNDIDQVQAAFKKMKELVIKGV